MGSLGACVVPLVQMSRELGEELARFRPHQHLCLLFESTDEWKAAVVPFLLLGLERNEECLYGAEPETGALLRDWLEEAGADVAAAEASGRLLITSTATLYTPGDSFDPDRMIDFWIQETRKATAAGYPGLRAVADMSWALAGCPGSERLPEYENRLNAELFAKYPCRGMCGYDRRRFPASVFRSLIRSHPTLARGDRIYRNFYYLPADDAETEVQCWLDNLDRMDRSEARFRRMFDSTIIGIVLGDFDGRLLEANDCFLDMLGYTREELLAGALRWDQLYPPEYLAQCRAITEEVRRRGSFRAECVCVRKDGARVPVLFGLSLLEGSLCIGYALDITARKKAETAIREGEARFRLLLDSGILGFVRGDFSGRITDANDYFLNLIGDTRDDLAAGRLRWDTITPPESAGLDARALEEVKARGTFAPYEKEFVRTDGARVWVLVAGARDGPREEGLAYVVDITERKRLEEELRQVQKMEAIGQLAGGVAHDFNNLLTAILGYGELALETVGRTHPAWEQIEEIRQAAIRAASLTSQLLAFSRRQTLQPQPFDLNALLEEMDNMLRRLIGEHIELITVPASVQGVVQADPGQVQRVILNLAVNARDAMPGGGQLILETADAPDGRVLLAVTDTGWGMDEQTRAHIFEPFFTTKGLGTGLGLSSVYGIVRQSGGDIRVHSQPGKGARFEILLPRPEKAASGAEAEPSAGGGQTILVVEDEQAVRSTVCQMLRRRGYTVLEAANGPDAIRLFETHTGKIDLLLTDVIMPQMSGPELADRLAALSPGLTWLFMSGYTDEPVHPQHAPQHALKPGAPFLQKPFSSARLAQKVREILEKP